MAINRPQRRSLRLPGFHYAQAGAYFVTICTRNKESLLGVIESGQMLINDFGQIIQTVWKELPTRFTGVGLDAFTLMPNHIHGIIIVGAQFIAPEAGVMNHAPTLGELVRAFKAVSTRLIRQNHNMKFSWQRNYYEHVIRDDESLNRIREYIINNPLRWELDRENPQSTGKDDFDLWLANYKMRPVRCLRAY